MALTGKIIDSIKIKAVGNLFHETFRDKPYTLSTMTSEIYACELLEGEWGSVGSVISFQYSDDIDGERKFVKEIVANIDNIKKSMVLKVIEGDVMEIFKSFVITYYVDDIGGDDYLVTWIFEYEKMNEDVPDPTVLMKYFGRITKDIEAYLTATPSLVVHQ